MRHVGTGFFTLGVGRLFGVETLTLAKIGAVVTRYVRVRCALPIPISIPIRLRPSTVATCQPHHDPD